MGVYGHPTPRYLARVQRRPVIDDLSANHRAHTVRADQHGAAVGGAVGEARDHTVAVLLEADALRIAANEAEVAERPLEHFEQLAAVHDERLAPPRDARHRPSGLVGLEQQRLERLSGDIAQGLAQAEHLESLLGHALDPGSRPQLRDLGPALVDRARHTVAPESHSQAEATDSSTYDYHLVFVGHWASPFAF